MPGSHVSTTCSRLFSSPARRRFPSRVCIECVFQTAPPFSAKYAAGYVGYSLLPHSTHTVFSHVIYRHKFVPFLLSLHLLRSFIAPGRGGGNEGGVVLVFLHIPFVQISKIDAEIFFFFFLLSNVDLITNIFPQVSNFVVSSIAASKKEELISLKDLKRWHSDDRHLIITNDFI